MAYLNHLSIGFDRFIYKDKPIISSVTNDTYKLFLENMEDNYEFEYVFVTPAVKHRPDLISNAFFDTVDLGWLVMVANNIRDPFEGFNIGDRIRIPKL